MEGNSYHFYELESLLQSLTSESVNELYDLIQAPGSISWEIPPQPEFGDLSTPLPLRLAKGLRRAPLKIAQEICTYLTAKKPVYIKEFVVTAPGYVNAWIDMQALTRSVFDQLVVDKDDYGRTTIGAGKKVVIEHTNINPNKAAHIGHLRNACLGDTLARLKKQVGYEVEVQNYIDDTGMAVADVVVAIQELSPELSKGHFDYQCWDLYTEINRRYEQDPRLEEKRYQVLKLIEEGDNPTAELAKNVADKVVECHLSTMWKLGIYYNLLNWESDIIHLGFWDHAFNLLKTKGQLIYEEEGENAGCWVVRLEDVPGFEDLENPDKVLVRSNGTATYTAKDIAYQLWKFGVLGKDFFYDRCCLQPNGTVLWTTSKEGTKMDRFGRADQVINVIDLRQKYLQDVLRFSLIKLGYEQEGENSIHFGYEVVALSPKTAQELGVPVDDDEKTVYAMSGRKGIGVKADDMINQVVEHATTEVAKRHPEMSSEEHRKLGLDIAVGAIRYYMVRFNISSVLVFDFDHALSMQGHTGPYLQYSYARAANILSRVEPEVLDDVDLRTVPVPEDLTTEEKDLIRIIAELPAAIQKAAETLQGSLFADYTYKLASSFMDFYETSPVLTATPARMRFRVALVLSFKQTMHNALTTLGIPALPRM
ncbi:MAG TPA: arginine--tRNA ligase [bacterium]|nr:arginine--tRNA ligase [bacterium]